MGFRDRDNNRRSGSSGKRPDFFISLTAKDRGEYVKGPSIGLWKSEKGPIARGSAKGKYADQLIDFIDKHADNGVSFSFFENDSEGERGGRSERRERSERRPRDDDEDRRERRRSEDTEERSSRRSRDEEKEEKDDDDDDGFGEEDEKPTRKPAKKPAKKPGRRK